MTWKKWKKERKNERKEGSRETINDRRKEKKGHENKGKNLRNERQHFDNSIGNIV